MRVARRRRRARALNAQHEAAEAPRVPRARRRHRHHRGERRRPTSRRSTACWPRRPARPTSAVAAQRHASRQASDNDEPRRRCSRRSGTTHVVAEEPGAPGGALRRSAPRPRGDLAAGLRRPARARARGAPPRPHRRDDGPLDADVAAAPRASSTTQAARAARAARDELHASSASRSTRSASAEQRHRARHRARARAHAAGHDHRLRRQPHLHARRVRRARLRHRHERGRARARDAVPAAAQAEDARGARRRRARAAASPPRTSSSRSSRRSASAAAPATSSSTPATAIRALDMEARMTVCNMSIEAGARAGHDRARRHDLPVPRRAASSRRKGAAWDAAVARWRSSPTDDGATLRRIVTLDAQRARADDHLRHQPGHGHPHRRAGRRPRRRRRRAALEKALRYMELDAGRAARSGSRSTSSSSARAPTARIADLRAGGAHLRRAARSPPACACWSCPGSQRSSARPRPRGSTAIFRDAGAEWREPGCSMCIAMNGDQLAARAVRGAAPATATSKGGRGSGGRTFLASPLTARPRRAVTGRVTDPHGRCLMRRR